MSVALAFAILLSAVSWAAAAERSWPGAPPDCWKEERIIHNTEFSDLWKANTVF